MPKTALFIVDPEKDFCPGGALAVTGGNDIMEPLNEMLNHADGKEWLVLVSRDWHPETTDHFDKWPVHCVRGTQGAEFHERLEIDLAVDVIVSKAMRPDEDGYSPLCANAYADPECLTSGIGAADDAAPVVAGLTDVVSYLREQGVDMLYIGGLATDYCVKAGVLDALNLPFIKKVYLLTDAIGAVDINPGDGQRAIDEMVAAGAILTTTAEVIGEEA